MGLFRGKGEPARAVVVPGSTEVEQMIAEILKRVDGSATAGVGLVLRGETGFQRVNQALPMWVIQVFRDVGTDRPLGRALSDGFDVPVRVDAKSGRIRSIETDRLVEELAPVRELASDVWRAQNGLTAPVRAAARAPRKLLDGMRAVRSDVADTVAEIRAAPAAPVVPRPTDESHPPIEGVGYDTWIRANVALGRGEIAGDDRAAAFERAGFPPGRVDEVDAAWWERAKADDAVGAWYGHDYQHLTLD